MGEKVKMSKTAGHISISIYNELAGLSTEPSEHCIFRVFDKLRRENKKAYEPVILSIGPYHHGKEKLKEMEKYKMLFLKQLLDRRDETSVDKYINFLISKEEEIRKRYSKPSKLNSENFAKMALLDSFFIIELFRKWWRDNKPKDTNKQVQQNDRIPIEKQSRDATDQFQHHERIASDIQRDLLLLENQLPYFIVAELFDMTRDPEEKEDFRVLAYSFLDNILPGPSCSETDLDNIRMDEIKHLLHLVHDCMCASFVKVASGSRDEEKEDENEEWEFINSVTELQEAGIEFKKVEESNSLFDINFDNGWLSAPQLMIDDDTESVLRNLIAYEQFLPDTDQRYVTDYARFLDCLVNSPKDATLLRNCGIIDNCLGDDDAVRMMLNKLTNGVRLSDNFCYSKVFNDMNKHCRLPCNIWKANLKHNYFNTPWAWISFLAAFVLLVLTVAQTVFSVLSYF